MFAELVDHNLYLMNILSFRQLALAAINKIIPTIWHSCLSHLGHQNIIQLGNMFPGIDLSQPRPQYVCIPYTETNMRVKPHIDMIQPGLQPLDFVNSNLSGPNTIEL